jgi:hypothetical protein
MEARSAIMALALFVVLVGTADAQYQVNTTNFSIHAPSVQMAKKAAHLAEQYRAQLSQEWLGYEIPQWNERCPIVIEISRHAGGETSFGFAGGSRDGTVKATPMGWQMKIFGPPDRVLDAVLPHEITHTIFATHFGRPLPRWADEGACTTVEHESERAKNHQLLLDFLTAKPSRGIPFNRMFTMKQYPDDILPLYAQGYSLAKFLIQQKGKRHFIKYIESGLAMERPVATLKGWDMATNEYYNFQDLSELQIAWVGWVKKGCPDLSQRQDSIAVASFESPDLPASRLAFASQNQDSYYAKQMQRDAEPVTPLTNSPVSTSNNTNGFAPGSVSAPVFKNPTVPDRQSATMSPKANTMWR